MTLLEAHELVDAQGAISALGINNRGQLYALVKHPAFPKYKQKSQEKGSCYLYSRAELQQFKAEHDILGFIKMQQGRSVWRPTVSPLMQQFLRTKYLNPPQEHSDAKRNHHA